MDVLKAVFGVTKTNHAAKVRVPGMLYGVPCNMNGCIHVSIPSSNNMFALK